MWWDMPVWHFISLLGLLNDGKNKVFVKTFFFLAASQTIKDITEFIWGPFLVCNGSWMWENDLTDHHRCTFIFWCPERLEHYEHGSVMNVNLTRNGFLSFFPDGRQPDSSSSSVLWAVMRILSDVVTSLMLHFSNYYFLSATDPRFLDWEVKGGFLRYCLERAVYFSINEESE